MSMSLLSMANVSAAQTSLPASSPMDILSLVLSLLIVLLTIGACAFVLQRWRPAQLGGAKLKLITQLPLGNRERIVVVELAGQQYLLGVTAQQITRLDKLSEPLELAKPTKVSGAFAKQLQTLLTKEQD